MTRGPKKHLKRLNAPKHWMLSKMGGNWAPKPSAGPHKERECLPLVLILRNRLKYALTRRETVMCVMRRLVQIDHKVRTDINFPAGFQDVITLEKTNEHFRMLYDTKGRFVLHRINADEANFKLLRVQQVSTGNKASIGRNPFVTGRMGAIPYVVTHDGRTIRYPDPEIKTNDTVKFDLKTGRITQCYKFDIGNIAMVTRGANVGRIAVIVNKEKHPGSHDIVHLKDRRGNEFATRMGNVFVIGKDDSPVISIPRAKGIKYTIIEERDMAHQEKAKAAAKAAKKK
jgi:small subunit ribosomal protein S4e